MGRRAVVLLLLVVTLSGCWSRIELNDLGIVLGIAVDVGEEEAVRLTLIVPHPMAEGPQAGGGSGQRETTWVVAREAANLTEAMALIRLAAARRLVFHHLRTVLIGEEYARTQGVADLLDTLAADQEVRLSVRPFVVEGRAQEVFETMPQLRDMQPNNLTGILQAKGGAEWRLKNLLVGRSSDTHTTWMHTVKVIKLPAGTATSPPTAVTLSGAALFRRDFLVHTLDPRQAQVLGWFLGNPKDSVITAPCPDSEKGTVSVRVLSGKARIQSGMRGGKPAFRVEVTARANLLRSECGVLLRDVADYRIVTERLSEDLRMRMEGFVATLQETGTDPVGFGKRMQLAYPSYFRTLDDRWIEDWRKATVTVTARVDVPQSGLMTGPAHSTDRELREGE